MAKLKLKSLIYTTTNKNKISKLVDLGATIIQGEEEIKLTISSLPSYDKTTADELKKLLTDAGANYNPNAKKQELYETLKSEVEKNGATKTPDKE